MTAEIELAKLHGIQYRLTPEGTTEMWCHDRNVQAFAEALVAAERERCAVLCDATSEFYQRHKGLKIDAQTGAAECAYAIRGDAQ